MHKYLRAVGFSGFHSNEEVEAFLENVVSEKHLTASADLGNGRHAEQYQMQVAPGMGLTVVGERDEKGIFHREYYFPYMRSQDATATDDCSVDRHTEKESYSAILEDYKTGIAMIFYLCNSVQYRQLKRRKGFKMKTAYLTGLAVEGKIILPLEKREEDEERIRLKDREQNALIEAARNGDQDAIETLTETDMDLFSRVSKRIEKEDLYSVIDTSFMPTGVECDQYQILGEITGIRLKTNLYTGENVIDLRLSCNQAVFHVCINESDLLGIPAIGRRFKGKIWMQGDLEFQTEL